MSLKAQDRVPQILKPYREKIDRLDREIIELLKARYDIIAEVGALKAKEGIDSFIQTRVDEVRENAARMASEKGLDEEFIRQLYAQLIQHSCDLEERIIESLRPPSKKTAA
jgi:chorismate mutase-like protein